MADEQTGPKKRPGAKALTKEEKIAAALALKQKRGGGAPPAAPVAEAPVAAAAVETTAAASAPPAAAPSPQPAPKPAARTAGDGASAKASAKAASAARTHEHGQGTPATRARASARPMRAASIRSRTKVESENEWMTVWPNLVLREILCCFLFSIVLWFVSLYFQSPLEELSNPNRTPNPSKAPWYFLGLQEMLVYFDPWIAGVVMPSIIIVGLMLIPFLDNNQTSVGYYTVKDRLFAWVVFTYGNVLWFVLIIIGTYMRGPSWAFYMPWESFEVHKPPPPDLHSLDPSIGGLIVAGYLVVGMILPAMVFPGFYRKRGPIRYTINIVLLLMMMGMMLKIVARLMFDIKYVLITPWFNI